MPQTPDTRLLHCAVETLGSEQHLADALSVSVAVVQEWLRGDKTPPFEVFSLALGVVARGPVRQPPRRLQ
jgi:DNA-binding transcriptional regulator YiaG